ncbi:MULTISPECIES: FGGY-family carbohydrate kinase [Rhizobium/Agrobacterium group]|uniref:FGGY-family carbohydrate kinase n=1 Tax=Rhizobium/Agrobacterium group TaxID=227290 RepID=UPI000B40138E|nr:MULTISPECIES: FGGY-family carbohydrate kinase [Rhizobium/Agrobacterium group]MCF1480674.1 carbohydrate kinase [Allorhizobium ampelinum]NSZ44526.1 carbohydrate kinase [Agrobacterium vitis]NTA28273.1 carbohydrate kinase [Allorhizobium ampelinum]OVE92914.1 carbohydrate kinase [Allorhizobium ampelinum]
MSKISETVAVIDIGKTNAKVVVLQASTGLELGCRRMPNTVVGEGPYPHFDTDKLWFFILDALKSFAAGPGFDAVSITTHGASAALLGADGELAMPVLDYEFRYPEAITLAYEALRPAFDETFSPRLPGGLNLGAQLHYQKTAFPELFAGVATIVTYPQYWAFRLTGVAANEATSLGCHTDLWRPQQGCYSSLVERLELSPYLAPLRSAFDALGEVKQSLAEQIGLSRAVPVYCGIHDSNASLLPHLLRREKPFTVVSTGTWIIGFAVGSTVARLDPVRDTLANVDAHGHAVPSCRYMGGREFEILVQGLEAPDEVEIERAAEQVISGDVMRLPCVVEGSGPYPTRSGGWTVVPEAAAQLYAAASLYTAMMTASSLSLIGATGPVLVEGPFAKNSLYLRALAACAGREVVVAEGGTPTGTAEGAALLTGMVVPMPREIHVGPDQLDLKTYFQDFQDQCGVVFPEASTPT